MVLRYKEQALLGTKWSSTQIRVGPKWGLFWDCLQSQHCFSSDNVYTRRLIINSACWKNLDPSKIGLHFGKLRIFQPVKLCDLREWSARRILGCSIQWQLQRYSKNPPQTNEHQQFSQFHKIPCMQVLWTEALACGYD